MKILISCSVFLFISLIVSSSGDMVAKRDKFWKCLPLPTLDSFCEEFLTSKTILVDLLAKWKLDPNWKLMDKCIEPLTESGYTLLCSKRREMLGITQPQDITDNKYETENSGDQIQGSIIQQFLLIVALIFPYFYH